MKQKKKSTALFALSALLLAVAVLLFNSDVVGFLPQGVVDALEGFTEGQFSDSVLAGITLADIGAALLALLITWLAVNVVVYITEHIPFKDKHAKTLCVLAGKIVKYAVYVLGAVVALGCLGVDANAILVSAGVLGLIIGFGAQSLVEDAITGLFILLEGEFSIGDIIAVDGFRGEVKNIGLRTVSIQDPGGSVRIVNNSELGSVVNLSNNKSAAVVNVPLSYDDPLEKCEDTIKGALAGLAERYPEIFPEDPVYTGVEELGDCNVFFMVIGYVAEQNVYDARRIMQREIRIACEKAGLASPVSV